MASASQHPRFIADVRGGNLLLDLFVLDQHLATVMRAVLHGSDVSPAQYAVYAQLAQGDAKPGEVSERLGLPPGTLTGYLHAMKRRGHLVRSMGLDGRTVVLSLTDPGRATYQECRRLVGRLVGRLEAQVGGPRERDRLREALGQLDAALLAIPGSDGPDR